MKYIKTTRPVFLDIITNSSTEVFVCPRENLDVKLSLFLREIFTSIVPNNYDDAIASIEVPCSFDPELIPQEKLDRLDIYIDMYKNGETANIEEDLSKFIVELLKDAGWVINEKDTGYYEVIEIVYSRFFYDKKPQFPFVAGDIILIIGDEIYIPESVSQFFENELGAIVHKF